MIFSGRQSQRVAALAHTFGKSGKGALGRETGDNGCAPCKIVPSVGKKECEWGEWKKNIARMDMDGDILG